MKIEVVYPNNNLKIKKPLLQKIIFIAFLITAVTCGIINIVIGGRAWSLCVIGAEILFWIIFVHKPVIENTVIGKISVAVLSVCAYLILLDVIYDNSWTLQAVPFIYFNILIINSIIFFFGFKRQKRNLLPLFFLVILSLAFFIASIAGALKTSMQVIILGSAALSITVSGFLLFKEQIKLELKKKFHM